MGDFVRVDAGERVRLDTDPGSPVAIKNFGPDTAYYGGENVSSISNTGSLAIGATLHLPPGYWFGSAGRSRLYQYAEAAPTSAGSGSVVENTNTVTASGSAVTLPDVTVATLHHVTLTASCTFTFPDPGLGKSFTLVLKQDATGGRTATWPVNVDWPDDVEPGLSTLPGKVDVFSFLCADGVNWLGFIRSVAAVPFTPASLSPTIWLKQSTLDAFSDGDPIGTWDEATQSSVGSRPIKQTVNGKSVARFAASANSKHFTLPDLSALTAAEVFMVFKLVTDPPAGASSTGMWKLGTDASGTNFPWTDGIIYDGFGTTARKTTVNPATSLSSAFRIYSVVSESAHWQSFLAGVSLYTTGTNTVAFPASPLLGWSGGSAFLDGDIAEFIIVPRALTTDERADMLAYLLTIAP